jgi:LAO/AO transport system kinase
VRRLDPAEAVDRARAGDRVALGRLITAVEERSEAAREIGRLLAPRTGRAHVVGITGSPGVGKSTTTSALLRYWREQGLTVAVVAVDPSSPFTGGALLGDRVRMTLHSTDPGVFIRSMAARGRLGGLAAATPAAVRVLDGCGFDLVVVETVGVGQSEVDIVRYADTVVILQAPGMGDRIQATKAGLLEIGDLFVVNKSDRPGANATKRELRAMVASRPRRPGDWQPTVLPIVATKGEGVPELADAIADHRAHGERTGELQQRRHARIEAELLGLATERLASALSSRQDSLSAFAEDVIAGRADPYDAADRLLHDVVDQWRAG